MKEKKCCTVDVTETEKGLRLEITGEKIKDCLSSLACCCASKTSESRDSGKARR
ncbi:MAG: hypothetical protein WC969_01040 [Elusimicrobiota bacterium]|jgi:hypothetical protein